MKLFEQPGGYRLGDWLTASLDADWAEFRAAVAFVKRSGVKHIAARLAAFAQTRPIEVIAGVDHQGTSYEGLGGLLEAVKPLGRVLVFHNALPHTFHPKVYLFKSSSRAEVAVGSGNLTEGGLYTNYEAGVQVTLDLTDEADRVRLKTVEETLDGWGATQAGTTVQLDEVSLESMLQSGLVLKEADMAAALPGKEHAGTSSPSSGTGDTVFPFEAVAVPAAPVPMQVAHNPSNALQQGVRRYVMTLQQTDVGVGQTTAGTARRSPEIFVPLKARNAEPEFWNWQDGFEEDQEKPGKYDRRGVRMRVGNEIVEVNMMTWPDKHDFRLRSEALRRLGAIEDILFMAKVDTPTYEYYVVAIPTGSPEYEAMRAKCDQSVPNSKRRFGYF